MCEAEIAAGCVVLRRGLTEPEVLLIWNKRYPDPTLPKGRVEAGESVLDCALREVLEETGYTVEAATDTPIVLKTVLDEHPPIVHKTINWFLAHANGGSPDQRTEDTRIVRVSWIPISDAIDLIGRADEIEALERCVELQKIRSY
jgi:8-oxo-dGTP diphosphatase